MASGFFDTDNFGGSPRRWVLMVECRESLNMGHFTNSTK